MGCLVIVLKILKKLNIKDKLESIRVLKFKLYEFEKQAHKLKSENKCIEDYLLLNKGIEYLKRKIKLMEDK